MKRNIWFECKNLSAYRNNYKVVRDLTLNLNSNENTVILGPNGSGKSSIIDLIYRNVYPVEKKNSYLKIFNKKLIDIWELRKKVSIINSDIRKRISGGLLVKELIISGLFEKYTKVNSVEKKDLEKVNKLINILDIKYMSKNRFEYLSDGEKQIALIARAMINNPQILILDEPTVNLDLRAKLSLTHRLNTISETNTKILLVTHDISLISKKYNRAIFLKNKEIIADGKPKDLLTTHNINKLYDVNIELINYKDNWVVTEKY